jgi:hypothetical protein|tara:strand:+ start:621 stop:911 length:291 start_codon:yes stop_codon:yes gene_type:complete
MKQLEQIDKAANNYLKTGDKQFKTLWYNLVSKFKGIKIIKKICEPCQGNGYRKIWEDTSETNKIIIQCSSCDSQGTIDVQDSSRIKELDKMWSRFI